MSITIPDEATAAALSAAAEPAEVLGPDGRVLGRFIPAAEKMSYPELGVTDAELDRTADDPNGVWYTTEQVLARLREIDRCGR
jgi:hypothetical protein